MTALHRAPAPETADSPELPRLRRPADRSLLPWSPDQLILVLIVDAVALGMIFASWYLISGEAGLASQMAWLKLGIFGIGLAAIGNGLWLLNGRRTIGLARATLLEPLAAAARAESKTNHLLVAPSQDLVYSGPSMARFHRQGCPLTEGKQLEALRRDDALDSGRIACETCEP